MYKSRHSEIYPRRRGGFSLFPMNEPQGVSGLGDIVDNTDFATWLNQQPLEMQTLQQSYLAANPPSVGAPSTGGFSIANVPMSAWLAILGTGMLLVVFSKK